MEVEIIEAYESGDKFSVKASVNKKLIMVRMPIEMKPFWKKRVAQSVKGMIEKNNTRKLDEELIGTKITLDKDFNVKDEK